jgi:protein-tyrosine phosphatase
LAEGILKSKVDTSKVWVDSAGTAGYHVGSLPDSRSIDTAQKHGIDITDQRCRKFNEEDFKTFDNIYVMDKNNYSNVVALAKSPEEKGKVKLLLKEANLAVSEVPDPYYGGIDGFEYVYDLIDQACDQIVKVLENGGN